MKRYITEKRQRVYSIIKEVVKEGHRRMQTVWTEDNISK